VGCFAEEEAVRLLKRESNMGSRTKRAY
jgi:hypothetical protein